MSFIKTTKKLFEPVILLPRVFFDSALESILLSVYLIFSLEITKNILETIEYNRNENFRFLIMIFFIISIIVSSLRFLVYKWWRARITYDSFKIYYKKYIKNFIYAEWNEVEKIWTWKFIAILERWIWEWMDILHMLFTEWIKNIIFIIYAIFAIFSISIIWWILSLILLLFWSYIATKANIYMRDKRMLRRKSQNEAIHQSVIALMSKNELMQNNWTDNFIWKISKNFEDAKNYQYPINIWFLVIEEFPKLMFLLIRIWVYIYLSYQVFLRTTSFSELAIFITILSLAELSMNNFLHILRNLLRVLSSIELLWSTFENLTPIKWFNEWKEFKMIQDKIILKNITYWYTDKNIFNNFSIEIKWWQKTAFVWVSWWWKTTLMKIISWYLRPEKWTVEIFWNNLKNTSLKSYFENIWYLTQEPSVFDWTIRENLEASVREEASEEIMIQALKNAECEFVFEFENWIDTEIWEKWIRLSWWQRQRLAIAKVFIKDPKIILLDEPTSALDSFSEEKITKAMHRLFKWRTVLVIAHRLQTVKEADDIILIEDWKILERWTHKELVSQKWIYKNMLDLQTGF